MHENVEIIEACAFRGCHSLDAVFLPSVKIIKTNAFNDCRKMRRVIMNENVETIERCAFHACDSLDAVFLPSSIKEIGNFAFSYCTNLRILSIPHTINIEKLGKGIIVGCDTFRHMHSAHLPPLEGNHNQVNQAIIDFNRNLPPLHQACHSTNVSTQSISQYITAHGTAATYNTDYGDGMTPMHVLTLNPHADASSIMTCFEANMGAALEPYSNGRSNSYPSALSGKTPLDYLAEYNVESHLSIVAALCRHRETHSASSSSVTLTVDETDDHTFRRRQMMN